VRRVRLLEEALVEAIEAAAWYDSKHPGLGADFDRDLNAALDLLEHDLVPLAAMPGRAGDLAAKRIMLRRFPYQLVIRELPDEHVVVAVAHQSRRPGYWRDRVRS
jgi:hypothetical protein